MQGFYSENYKIVLRKNETINKLRNNPSLWKINSKYFSN